MRFMISASWYNDQALILISSEAKKAIAIDLNFALLVAVLKPQLHVLAQGLASLAGQREAIIVSMTSP